jgi:hypothetical protein
VGAGWAHAAGALAKALHYRPWGQVKPSYRVERNDPKRDAVVQGLLALYASTRDSWQDAKVISRPQGSVSQEAGSPATRLGLRPRDS